MWNYRVVKYANGEGFGLHEVYYDDDGVAWAMSAKPDSFTGDYAEEVIDALKMALEDTKRPVFNEPKTWPKEKVEDKLTDNQRELYDLIQSDPAYRTMFNILSGVAK